MGANRRMYRILFAGTGARLASVAVSASQHAPRSLRGPDYAVRHVLRKPVVGACQFGIWRVVRDYRYRGIERGRIVCTLARLARAGAAESTYTRCIRAAPFAILVSVFLGGVAAGESAESCADDIF